MVNAEYMDRWRENSRRVGKAKDEEARRMREHFEQELMLSANSAQYKMLYALGELDSWSSKAEKPWPR